MAPTQMSKGDLIAKDAMYLLEFLRDSPQPILLHIGPYAEKTGTKPNTIIKRLGEIRKRNGLNIATTAVVPDGIRVPAAARVQTPQVPVASTSSSVPDQNNNSISQSTPTNNRKATVRATKLSAPKQQVKVETEEAKPHPSLPTPTTAPYGLPSPAASISVPPLDASMHMPVPVEVKSEPEFSATPAAPFVPAEMRTAARQQVPINSYLAQKRPIIIEDDSDDDNYQNHTAIKRMKTEL